MEENKLGVYIRKRRKELGITQKRLSELLNMSQQNISNIENGKNIPPPYLIIQLGDALSVSYDYLLGLLNKKEKIEQPKILEYLEADPVIAPEVKKMLRMIIEEQYKILK
jgi:transcriptional regulator with XRE-family HTH domain